MYNLVACVAAVFMSFSTMGFAQTIKIGAWNVLADSSSSGFRYIKDERIPNIAAVIAYIEPDVLAVSEVAPNNRFRRITEELRDLGHCYEYTYRSQPSPDTKMNVGFIHKCGISVTNVELLSNTGYEPRNKREALQASFTVGSFDFTAIAVHLKSGGYSSRPLRNEQVKKIWSVIEAEILPNEKDVIVLGDYNMDPERDPENFENLNPEGKLRFISSEIEPFSGDSQVWSHINRSCRKGNFLDGMSIGASTTEYIEDTVELIPAHEVFANGDLCEFKKSYSDHLPLVAVFRNADED